MLPAPSEDSPKSLDAADMRDLCCGDQDAFARIVQRHQERILGYSLRVIGNLQSAQDVTQEVFLTLWNQRKSYQERGLLLHYLMRIARHRSLAELKRQRRYSRLLGKKMQAQTDSPRIPSDDFAIELTPLMKALPRVKDKYRDLIVLRHLEELSLDEIQSLTGIAIGTIKSRLHRGMKALREELENV